MRKSIAEYSAQYPHLKFEKVSSQKTFGDGFKDGLCSALLPISSVSFQESIESVRKIIHSMKANNERTTKTMTTNESLSQKQAEAKKLQDQLATVEAEINRLNEIQETECNVTMKPVCDCGHVFTDLAIDTNMIEDNHRSTTPDINIPRFSPVTCPNCHKRIMGIKNPAYRNSGMCSEGNIVTFAKEK